MGGQEFGQLEQQVLQLGDPVLHLAFISQAQVHEVVSCGGTTAADEAFVDRARASVAFLINSCLQVPRSLSLRVMLAALLRHLGEIDGGRFQSARKDLSRLAPPFGSWSTSAPASEDNWLDPADEVVDPTSGYTWQTQVGHFNS